jgi:hypothetical protein
MFKWKTVIKHTIQLEIEARCAVPWEGYKFAVTPLRQWSRNMARTATEGLTPF